MISASSQFTNSKCANLYSYKQKAFRKFTIYKHSTCAKSLRFICDKFITESLHSAKTETNIIVIGLLDQKSTTGIERCQIIIKPFTTTMVRCAYCKNGLILPQ